MRNMKWTKSWYAQKETRTLVYKPVSRRWRTSMAIGALALIAGCAERPDSSIRPLVDVDLYENDLSGLGNDEVKARLEQLVEEVGDLTESSRDWAVVTTDLVNSEIQDVAFFSAAREAALFGGGGDASASIASSSDWAVFTMSASETASCWGIRFSGNPAYPTIEYSNIFSPGCSAAQMVDEGVWYNQWPEPAPPPTDGTITFGDPLFP